MATNIREKNLTILFYLSAIQQIDNAKFLTSMIKIEEIREFTAHIVETKKHTYTRYSPQCWTIIMGESEEPVYDCEELEEAYQKYKTALHV